MPYTSTAESPSTDRWSGMAPDPPSAWLIPPPRSPWNGFVGWPPCCRTSTPISGTQSSVRLRRFNGRRLTALAAEDVEALLMSAGPDVRAVRGARQTDFVSVRCDKGLGLVRLLSELGQQGRVISVRRLRH